MILGVEPVVSHGYHPPSRLLLSGVPLLALPEIDGLSHRRRKKTGALGGKSSAVGGRYKKLSKRASSQASEMVLSRREMMASTPADKAW